MTARPIVLAAIQEAVQDDVADSALLDPDSLGRVWLVMELEERFDVDIADHVAFGWVTVGDVVAWAEREMRA